MNLEGQACEQELGRFESFRKKGQAGIDVVAIDADDMGGGNKARGISVLHGPMLIRQGHVKLSIRLFSKYSFISSTKKTSLVLDGWGRRGHQSCV